MKTNLKTLGIIPMVAMFLIVAVLPTHAQEQKTQFLVKPGEKQTNPEFIKRLADPELNPELARRIPDPTARLKEAQAVASGFCQNFTTSVSVVSTAQGCFIDVTYSNTYTYVPNTTNACILPHGLYVEVGSQAQIQSATVISGPGAWLSGVTPVLSANSVYWVKSCPIAGNNYSNIIPSGQTLTVRIKLASGFCPGSCTVTVRELTGWAFPNNTQFWSCQQFHTITTPVVKYSIGPDTSVCTGSAFTISVVPPPPQGFTVKWYKYTPSQCSDPCPSAPCPIDTPWELAQTGGSNFNTNILTQTTCYVAMVEYGCGVWVSNVRRVNVCPGPPSGSINPIPAPTSPPTTLINNVPHACNSWSGQLCLNLPPQCCTPQIVRWEWRTRALTYPNACNPQWGAWSTWTPRPGSAGQTCISTGNLTVLGACQRQYEFRAVLQNACGTSTPSYTIVIDRPPVPGSITAYPLPPLCYDKATKLTYSTSCAEVVEWEKREELSPCTNTWGPWTPIPGSQGTCVWWTNNLQKTTQYRVKVKNGACPPVNSPPVYSQVYTVTVKPQLSVTVSANQTVLCQPVTLTAQTTYGQPCSYPVSYQWYQDGLPITGATSSTYSPTSPGNYYVVVSDSCGEAKSNVITLCGKPRLEIDAPCCVCPGETITVTANVLWLPANCQPPSCTYQWNTGATTPSISVTSPGTYTVTVTCGICPPMKQSVTIEACR